MLEDLEEVGKVEQVLRLLVPPPQLSLLQSLVSALNSGNDDHHCDDDERRGHRHIPQVDGDHCEDGHRA